MTPEQWTRVKDIFNAVLEQEGSARHGFLVKATAGDDVVRSEVERLLDAQAAAAGFIEHSAATTPSRDGLARASSTDVFCSCGPMLTPACRS